MLHFTLIARQQDMLALSADTENSGGPELERNKVTAKNILRKLSSDANKATFATTPLLTVESQNYAYHVLAENGVLFLTMCDTVSPSAIAFAYLEDVAREFLQQYGPQVASATRPYTFIKFDLYLQKTKKVFSSATSGRSAAALRLTGRPMPVKKTFREVMGHVDGALGAKGASGSSAAGGAVKGKSDPILLYAAVGVSALVLVILILYFVLM